MISPSRGVLHRTMRRWPTVAVSVAAIAASTSIASGAITQAHAADSLLSGDRPVTSSSIENSGTPANAVTDGDTTTRWSSAWSDPQWIDIDLGASSNIDKVVLQWETAYGKAFQIQDSADNTNWTTIYSTTSGTGGNQTLSVSGTGRYVRMYGTARGTGYGYSLYEFQVYGTPVVPPSTAGYIFADPPVTGVTPSQYTPPNAYFHEFQANCSYTHTAPDDPIIFPNQPGASHMHTFLGNTLTSANTTTTAQLDTGSTTCLAPGDKSAYWMPTMYNNGQEIDPSGPQVIYYKSGVLDYTSVRPFPKGLRFVVGSPNATPPQFLAASYEGWECGNSYYNSDFPPTCPAGTQLNIRYQAPSCWDGIHLDTPDHQSHMAYPVNGRCTAAHPVALPMIEFKMAFPVSGDLSKLVLSPFNDTGRGYSFHYDFFNDWDPATLQAMVTHCINGGLQCDARGYDQTQPSKGAALNASYELP